MPFTCAKAVCATFCAPIAGALIPIFGPDFPSQCTSPEAPEHGRMAIDPKIVADSAREAELFRRVYANASSVAANSQLPEQQHHHHHHVHHTQTRVGGGGGGGGHNNCGHGPALPSPTSIPSPRLARRALNVQQQRYGSPQDFERERAGLDDRVRFHHHKSGPSSPYATDSEPDMHHHHHHHHHAGPEMPSLHHALNRGGLPYSPLSPPRSSGHGSSWTVVNHPPHHSPPSSQYLQQVSAAPTGSYPTGTYRESDLPYADSISGSVVPGPNPILSAIPRFGQVHGLEHRRRHQSPHSAHQQQQEHQPRLPPLSSSVIATPWQHNDATPRDSLHIFHPPLRSNHHHHYIPMVSAAKRPAAEAVDAEYDECSTTTSSDKSSPTATTSSFNTSLCSQTSAATAAGGGRDDDRDYDRDERYYHYYSRREPAVQGPLPPPPAHARPLLTSGVDKSAALLLMNLSVRDHKDARRRGGEEEGSEVMVGVRCSGREGGGDVGGAVSAAVAGGAAVGRALRGCGPESMSMSPVSGAADGHRSKRRRATSM